MLGWLHSWEQKIELKEAELSLLKEISPWDMDIYYLKFNATRDLKNTINLYSLRAKRLRSALRLIEYGGDMIDVDDVRAKSDMVRVAESYGYEVKRKLIHCPYHNEKTPSMHLYIDHFHCFGCNEHGSVFDFIMKMEGCEFIEAVKIADNI